MPLAEKLTGAKLQETALDGLIEILGGLLTFTLTVVVPIQPFAFVPETVYTVAVLGLATTVAPTVVDKPVEGLQE
jgi:hypothetical protein